jgi:hypothetical protein
MPAHPVQLGNELSYLSFKRSFLGQYQCGTKPKGKEAEQEEFFPKANPIKKLRNQNRTAAERNRTFLAVEWCTQLPLEKNRNRLGAI